MHESTPIKFFELSSNIISLDSTPSASQLLNYVYEKEWSYFWYYKKIHNHLFRYSYIYFCFMISDDMKAVCTGLIGAYLMWLHSKIALRYNPFVGSFWSSFGAFCLPTDNNAPAENGFKLAIFSVFFYIILCDIRYKQLFYFPLVLLFLTKKQDL